MSKRGTNWYKHWPTWSRHTRGVECTIMQVPGLGFQVSCHGNTWQVIGNAPTFHQAKLLAARFVRENHKQQLSHPPTPIN